MLRIPMAYIINKLQIGSPSLEPQEMAFYNVETLTISKREHKNLHPPQKN